MTADCSFLFSAPRQEETLKRRPKLLFLSWYFRPASAIACVRTWNIAKYLVRLGWDVTVVTPHPSVWRDIENLESLEADLKREGIRRILTGQRWRCLAPAHLDCWNQGIGWLVGGSCRKIMRSLGIDSAIGWTKPAERACSALTAEDVDIILASSPPVVAFKLAKCLSDRLGRPYILDYRDPWTGDPHPDRPARLGTIREEARLLAGSAGVTIVSRSWGRSIDARFGLGPKLHIVTNGFDPDDLADVRPHDFRHFAIVYAGTFYPPKRVISPIMAALKRLKEIANGKVREWYFHYYGPHQNHVREESERFGITERVVLHGSVPRAEALSALRGAGVAVVITSVFEEDSLEDKGIVTGKVFEALGLGTPVLLVAPRGSDVMTVAETTGLARSFTGGDVDGMALFLSEASSGVALKPKNLEAYAWPNIAGRLDAILRESLERAILDKSKISG